MKQFSASWKLTANEIIHTELVLKIYHLQTNASVGS